MSTRHPKNRQQISGGRKDAHRYKGIDLEVFDRAVPKGAAAVARALLAAAAQLERDAGHTENDVILGASSATILLAYASPVPRREWLINWLRHLEAGIREEDKYDVRIKQARALLRELPPDPARPAGPTTKGPLQ